MPLGLAGEQQLLHSWLELLLWLSLLLLFCLCTSSKAAAASDFRLMRHWQRLPTSVLTSQWGHQLIDVTTAITGAAAHASVQPQTSKLV
jgi:hypothetical protein